MLLSSPSPCEAPRACVQAFHPEHVHPCLEASLPEKVKARNTQSRLESGMRHGFPCSNVINSASSWEFGVCKCRAARIHSTWVPVWLPQAGSRVSRSWTVWSVHRWSLAHRTPLLCVLLFPWSFSLADPEKRREERINIKGLNWGKLKMKQADMHWFSKIILPSCLRYNLV